MARFLWDFIKSIHGLRGTNDTEKILDFGKFLVAMATKRKKLKYQFSLKLAIRFQYCLVEIVIRWPSTKIHKISGTNISWKIFKIFYSETTYSLDLSYWVCSVTWLSSTNFDMTSSITWLMPVKPGERVEAILASCVYRGKSSNSLKSIFKTNGQILMRLHQ